MKECEERYTLKQRERTELVEKKSVFIGTAAPIVSEEEAREMLSGIRREYYDATHHVYAYILHDGGVARYSDDGEPQGTAGIPVLNVLKTAGVSDACIVVTRYFGGTLLGTGGLVRAYSAAAKQVLAAAQIVKMTLFARILVRIGYSDYQKVTALLPRWGASEDQTDFAADVTVQIGVVSHAVEMVQKQLSEITGGRAYTEILGYEERPEAVDSKKK